MPAGQAVEASASLPPPPAAVPASARRRALLLLAAGMFWMQASMSISTQSNYAFAATIWDDPGQIATFCGQLVGSSALVEFIFNPTFGGLCDRFGRRPCLLICPLVNTVGRLMQMANPTTTTLWITRPVTGCAVQVFFTALRSSIADLIAGQDERTAVLGRIYSVQMTAFMLCGILAGRVTARWSFYGGYAGSAVASTLAFLSLAVGLFPETLRERKPFTTINPLSFLQLFNPRGIYAEPVAAAARQSGELVEPVEEAAGQSGVGRLAVVYALQKGTGIPAITEARTAYLLALGWSPVARSNYLTSVGVVGMVGNWFTGASVAALGVRGSTRAGNLTQAAVMVGTGLSRSATGVYLSLLPGLPFAAETAVEAALSTHAEAVGVGQGKLNADVGNLIALMKVFMPVIYARLLAVGLPRNLPGAAFLFTAVCYLAAEVLLCTVPARNFRSRKAVAAA